MLTVNVQQYKPNIGCSKPYRPMPDSETCESLLATMPASTDRRLFGKKNEQGVGINETLPKVFAVSRGQSVSATVPEL